MIFFQNKDKFKRIFFLGLKVIFQLEENITTSIDVFQKVLRITTNILLNINNFFTFFKVKWTLSTNR